MKPAVLIPLLLSIAAAPALLACQGNSATTDASPPAPPPAATPAAATTTAAAATTPAPLAPVGPAAVAHPGAARALTVDGGTATLGDGGAVPATPFEVPSGLASALRGIPSTFPSTLPSGFKIPPLPGATPTNKP